MRNLTRGSCGGNNPDSLVFGQAVYPGNPAGPFDDEMVDGAACVAATGMNHIDLDAAAEQGIAVRNAVGYSTHAVTETTIGAAIIWGAAQPLGVMFGSWKGFGLCTALGIVTCYLPYLLYIYGLTGLETGKASILASFEPVVATLVGIFVFHEKLTLLSALGCVCVLSAVVLLNLKRRQKAN